jgi:hypothetical protein
MPKGRIFSFLGPLYKIAIARDQMFGQGWEIIFILGLNGQTLK